MPIESIAVFCGSYPGKDPALCQAADTLGRVLAQQGMRIVFGGSRVGLMGALAQSALEEGAHIIGVMPEFLNDFEVAHTGLSSIEWVPDFPTRKTRLVELSDAFVILPGGLGTMDELFEVWTQLQLGEFKKPIGILNTKGFYDRLIAQFKHMADEGFVDQAVVDILVVDDQVERLIESLKNVSDFPTKVKHLKSLVEDA